MHRPFKALILAVSSFGLWGTSLVSFAQDTAPDPNVLRDIEREQADAKAQEIALNKEREALRAEIAQLKRDLIVTASEAETYENAARNIDSRITNLEQERTVIRRRMTQDQDALTQFLAALQRISTSTPPAIIGQATTSLEAVQAAHLMASLSEKIQARTDALKVQLDALSQNQKQTGQVQNQLAENEVELIRKRDEIRALVAQKEEKEKTIAVQSEAIRQRANALAREAETLRDLIARFEQAARTVAPRVKPGRTPNALSPPRRPLDIVPRLKPPRSPKAGARLVDLPPLPDTLRFSDARGRLRAPVPGRVIQNFGRDQKGMTVSARRRASVIAPYSGRVEFAGPFKNYDNVIILNVGDDYFILMTGLGNIYAKTGDVLSAGAPIGIMPSGPEKSVDLYIEFRKDGAPINPKPWLGTAFASSG